MLEKVQAMLADALNLPLSKVTPDIRGLFPYFSIKMRGIFVCHKRRDMV